MATNDPPAGLRDDGEAASLRDYFAALRRRWPVIAFFTVAVTVGAIVFSSRQHPLYKASADVLISQTNLAASLTGVNQTASAVPEDRYGQTQTELAREPSVASLAAKSVRGARLSAGDLLKSSSVAVGQNSDILTFAVSNRHPALAAALATSYARAYVTFRRRLDMATLQSARDGVEAELDRLRSTGQGNTPLASDLATKAVELQTMEAVQNANATLVRSGDSATKVQPRPKLYAAYGLVAGFLLGLVVAALLEALDTRVRSEEELTSALGLPLLGRIPELRGRRSAGKPQPPVLITSPTSPEAEAFRKLRAGVDLANLRHGARSILITSAILNEGKSTIAANLAVAMAQAGRHVSLVDFDLRAPALLDVFDLPSTRGLTDLALETIEFDDALQPVAVSGRGADGGWMEGSLDVLVPGMLPPDPASFIEAPVVSKLLDELGRRSDLILIDSPPLLSVGDTAALLPKVDAVILVASRKNLRRPMLAEVRRLLGSSQTIPLGVVATNTAEAFASPYEPAPSRKAAKKRSAVHESSSKAMESK